MPPRRRKFILDNQFSILKESNIPVGIQIFLVAVFTVIEEDRQRGDAGTVRKIQQHALITTLNFILTHIVAALGVPGEP